MAISVDVRLSQKLIHFSKVCLYLKLVFRFSSLLSMSTPKSVKEFFHLRGISLHIVLLGSKNLPNGITLVLSRLEPSPDITLKSLMYHTADLKECSSLSTAIDVSSANV